MGDSNNSVKSLNTDTDISIGTSNYNVGLPRKKFIAHTIMKTSASETQKSVPMPLAQMPGLRNVSSTSTNRFVSSPFTGVKTNTIPITIQNLSGKPSNPMPDLMTSSNVQKIDPGPPVTMTVMSMGTNKVITTPSGSNTSAYHMPRGPAAVANISIPRSSMATSIRGPPVSTSGGPTFMPGLSLKPVGSGPWLVTTSNLTSPTNNRPVTSSTTITSASSNFIPSTVVRHNNMTVQAKVTPVPRMPSDQTMRPVLLQKQILTGAGSPQMVHVTDGNKGFIKTSLPLRSPLSAGGPRLLQASGPARLPSNIVPVLVPSGSSLIKTNTSLGPKVMVQPSHGTPIQITSVPNSVQNKPVGFHIAQNTTSNSQPQSKPLPNSTSSIQGNVAHHITFSKSIPATSHTNNPPNLTSVSVPAYYYEPNSSNTNVVTAPSQAHYQIAPISTIRHQLPSSSNFATSISHPRSNQTSTIISVPRGSTSQFSLPIHRLVAPPHSQNQNQSPNIITNVVVAPRGSVSPSISTSHSSNTSMGGPNARFNSSMLIDSNRQSAIHHTFVPVTSCEGSGDESPSTTQSIPSAVKPNASPRPSILRKRESEITIPTKVQKNLVPLLNASSSQQHSVPISLPSSPPSPPKRPDSRNSNSAGSMSQSSGSSNLSGVSSPAHNNDQSNDPVEHSSQESTAAQHISVVVGGMPPSSVVNNLNNNSVPVEMSPRKKPRKQLLTGDSQDRKMEGEDMEFISEDKIRIDHFREENGEPHVGVPQQYLPPQSSSAVIENSTPTSTSKKPRLSIMESYRQGWKSRHYHFMRYSDVKPKDERRPTLSDIASQKHILQRINGWKVYHLRTQMENMSTAETEYSSRLNKLLDSFGPSESNEKEVDKVHELIKGNVQRSNVIKDQLMEAHSHIMKIFEHKATVLDLITRNGNRRTIKKRDKYST